MNKIKHVMLGISALALGLTACQDDYDAPSLIVPQATLVPNTTLADFKTRYADATAELVPMKDDQTPIVLHGRVISCDASGNIYQNLVIQDETAAINISIRRQNMWTDYRVGQDVVVNATGLYMGNYSGLLQLGALGEYQGGPSMTFMGWDVWLEHNQLNGLPDDNFKYLGIDDEWPAERPYCLVTTITELNSIGGTTEQGRNIMSQLVEIQNVSFEGGGKEIFAEYKESNERRYIVDSNNQRLAVNNSGYASFRNEILPEGTGTVRGILGYYQDSWQLTIRGLEDVIFNEKGTQDDPYSVAEALAQHSNGRSGWTRGYIVGSVKAGVNNVESSDDIIFGAQAETLNNLLIADSADETDFSRCIIVNLPSGTKLRQYVNLVDNPEMIGQLLTLNGSYNEFMGMDGITGNAGTLADFNVEGADFSGALGSGTEASPFQVDYLIQNPEPLSDVWVTGYIVGFVSGRSFDEGAVFDNNTAGADYNGANIILSSQPTGANLGNSIPVACDRNTVGLLKNPSNFGRKVKFKGNAGDYLGAFGMSSTSTVIFE